MIRLGDLKTFGEGTSDAFTHAVPIREDFEGPALVIAPHVVPDTVAENFLLESDLANCGKPLVFPTISDVTGTFVRRGITFVPEGTTLSVKDVLTIPHPLGRFAGNGTPDSAFQMSHALWQGRELPNDAHQKMHMALELSLGADAPNGEWWMAGALAGVLRLSADAELDALLDDPTVLLSRLNAMAAQVRQKLMLPVQILDPRQSAATKSMLTELAPQDYWDDFVAVSDDIGLRQIADRYKAAAERIWG